MFSMIASADLRSEVEGYIREYGKYDEGSISGLHISRKCGSVFPVMSHSLRRYSYALSALAPTEKRSEEGAPLDVAN